MPKTIKSCVLDMLEDLGETQLRKFRTRLLDRREEPRIKRSAVEKKDIYDISDVLVSTFTEPGALKVSLEILRDIGCNEEAEILEAATSGLSSAAGSSTGKHFVDKHQEELIQRVSMVSPILDKLQTEGVIGQECYDIIRSKPTPQERMRELFKSLRASGDRGKDILYDFLEKQEKYLMEDLRQNEIQIGCSEEERESGATMAMNKWVLLETLEDLTNEEFKKFKWFLHQPDILEGFPAIPRSRLERADRPDTVDLMVQIYNQHSLEATKKVLMKINRNDLVQRLPSSLTKRATMTVGEKLLETLEDLGDEDFKRFKWFLHQPDILEGFPAIRGSRLEHADRQDTVDQMLQIYSEHSLEVTMKVLMKINRNDLVQCLSNTSSGPKALGSSAGASGVGTTVRALGSSAGASGVGPTVREKHFVDKHRSALIQRVNNVAPILDELFDYDVIDQEGYNNIMSKSTTQEQMRELYKGPLHASGDRGKDIFYDILEKKEKFLMDDLKNNS
ncbi:uncharacterized protein [Centroberyx affinis]|uniref:uncharacterized protein n=1 Tax=Centroberyx affinis TaxID=166261 RepID=UPI003A5BAC85